MNTDQKLEQYDYRSYSYCTLNRDIKESAAIQLCGLGLPITELVKHSLKLVVPDCYAGLEFTSKCILVGSQHSPGRLIRKALKMEFKWPVSEWCEIRMIWVISHFGTKWAAMQSAEYGRDVIQPSWSM